MLLSLFIKKNELKILELINQLSFSETIDQLTLLEELNITRTSLSRYITIINDQLKLADFDHSPKIVRSSGGFHLTYEKETNFAPSEAQTKHDMIIIFLNYFLQNSYSYFIVKTLILHQEVSSNKLIKDIAISQSYLATVIKKTNEKLAPLKIQILQQNKKTTLTGSFPNILAFQYLFLDFYQNYGGSSSAEDAINTSYSTLTFEDLITNTQLLRGSLNLENHDLTFFLNLFYNTLKKNSSLHDKHFYKYLADKALRNSSFYIKQFLTEQVYTPQEKNTLIKKLASGESVLLARAHEISNYFQHITGLSNNKETLFFDILLKLVNLELFDMTMNKVISDPILIHTYDLETLHDYYKNEVDLSEDTRLLLENNMSFFNILLNNFFQYDYATTLTIAFDIKQNAFLTKHLTLLVSKLFAASVKVVPKTSKQIDLYISNKFNLAPPAEHFFYFANTYTEETLEDVTRSITKLYIRKVMAEKKLAAKLAKVPPIHK
ncbi:helix-turn-helix domain-containing protein [Vagococcus sp. PNs007]|uniref:Helix-turn-helix domain-containing protein n=1 Tax=Vagococcus proximus TaxID=2991417 RepID=A0ABT5WZ46_9ENTE|nr:helix-turn-helix domain-containing protein [Vagococcus proximus]MDF0479040.1 helix-turn-helix domain-containing protein [Vagococcus proximus]